jgi:hypothetical protein
LVAPRNRGRLKEIARQGSLRHVQGRTEIAGRPKHRAGIVGQDLASEDQGFLAGRWWGIVDYKIGIVPLPVFLILHGLHQGLELPLFVHSCIIVVGGWLKMYPIDTAIVTACHSGQATPATSRS